MHRCLALCFFHICQYTSSNLCVFVSSLCPVVSQNLVTENVSVVEGEMAIISCRVKNNDDSVIQLLNPNRQTIYFRDMRREYDTTTSLLSLLFQLRFLCFCLYNVFISFWVGGKNNGFMERSHCLNH